ncbi:glycine betaine ABC transporter substrate-binding protein [Paludibaculum fermentans]|uniref:ABC transporter permease subunit n=1 Tax=Paludibaculum fermentans TaxID=1473598 RepID=A0A7S7NW45_PALFE|nr:glycine betaine ABC transporter substrate-binding protein [Paludibaculum fermentans]QOY90903.1 ABC transporter permease subunit [Paludibaculum fermentans]
MNEQLQLLPGYLSAHLGLTLAAILVGVLVSVPLGVLVAGSKRLEPFVLGTASVIQTVPSLALLAFMVPALAALGMQSIGYLPALIGLCLYSVLPILRNTLVGLASIEPALLEAAQSVGMTPGEQLFRVELPLALPMIIAGIRTATVWTVGTATLSTPVGAPSLGNYIFSGLQTRNYAAVLVGCVAAALLALALDGLIRVVELGLRLRRRALWIGALCVFAALAAWPLARLAGAFAGGGARPVRIGAKNFTEQYILSRIMSGRIHERTGQPTELIESLGSTVVFDALRNGQIDVYVDYTGTLWANILERKDRPPNRAEVLEGTRSGLRERFGVELLAALGFENAYALAMNGQQAEELNVRKISDLIPYAPKLRLGSDYEFLSRPEWKALEARYGLRFQEQRSMDPALMYQALRSGGVDLISAFSTDGRIVPYHLRVLEDDRGAIPPYDAVILVNAVFAREQPAVLDALRSLAQSIDGERMRALNAEVDQSRHSPAEAAAGFLKGAGHR